MNFSAFNGVAIFLLFISNVAFANLDKNYEYAIVLNSSASTSAQLNIDGIINAQKNNAAVKKAVTDSLRDTLVPMVKLVNPASLVDQDNIQQIVLKSLNTFTTALQKHMKKLPLSQPQRYQIQIVPVISKVLAARIHGGEIPYKGYSTDKFSVYENMPDTESAYKTTRDFMVTEAYQGQMKLVEEQSASENPFFVSMLIDLDLQVDSSTSKVTTQVIVGMPNNKKIPFTQSNDQIQFQWMHFPNLTKDQLGLVSQYPCAFVTIAQGFNEAPVQMNIQFGPMGTYSQEGLWTRPNGVDYKQLVPRLTGVPKLKGIMLKPLPVDFNIFNLNVNLETQSISDLDLHLWVKFISKLPMVGMINKESVDKQFQDEINKTVQVEIAKQKESLKTKGIEAVSSNSSMPPEAMGALLENVFRISKGGRP